MFCVLCQEISVRSRPRGSGRQRKELNAIVVCSLGYLLYRAPSRSLAHVVMSRPERCNQKLGQRNSTCTTGSPQCCSTHTFEPSDVYTFICSAEPFAQVAFDPGGFEEARQQEREERCDEIGRRRLRLKKKHTKHNKHGIHCDTHPPAHEHQQNVAACAR